MRSIWHLWVSHSTQAAVIAPGSDLAPLVRNGIVPIGMGGDHSITLGELRAVAKVYGPVALVHFDAHNDTDDSPFGLKYNHGTPFRWAAAEGLLDLKHSVSVGMRGSQYIASVINPHRRYVFCCITNGFSLSRHDIYDQK